MDMAEKFLMEQTPRYDNFFSSLMGGKSPERTDTKELQHAITPQGQAQAAQNNPVAFKIGKQAGQQAIAQNPQLQQQVKQNAYQMTTPRPEYRNRNFIQRQIYSPSSMRANDAKTLEQMQAWDEQKRNYALANSLPANSPYAPGIAQGYEPAIEAYYDSLKKGEAKSPYTNFKVDPVNGKTVAFNKNTNQMEVIPGAALGIKQDGSLKEKPMTTVQKIEAGQKYQTKYNQTTAKFRDSADVFNNMLSLATPDANGNYSAAADDALIYMWARMKSPGIVTDSDFEQAKASGGLRKKADIWLKQMKDGRLPETVRNDLINSAGKLNNIALKRIKERRNFYSKAANEYGIPTSQIYDTERPLNKYKPGGESAVMPSSGRGSESYKADLRAKINEAKKKKEAATKSTIAPRMGNR